MSDKSEGPGWWIASDGKWYPPELHPSVRDNSPPEGPAKEPAVAGEGSAPRRWQGQADKEVHVGPQFPDLFQKAMQGSHLADNVSVKWDGDERRQESRPTVGTARTVSGSRSGSTPVTAGAVGATFGAPAPSKRKWRKGR